MLSTTSVFRRLSLAGVAVFAVMLSCRTCPAVVSFELPQVQVAPNMSGGPTTGSFNVVVRAAPADLPRLIGSLNVDFSVANTLVALGPPSIPTVNPLLSDPGPPGNPFFIDGSPSLTDQTVRWAHDVPVDQPLGDGKALVSVQFSVPAGLTGTFPLSFGSMEFNGLADTNANAVAVNISDTGSITVALAPVGVPGDYNSNGVVDAADYVVWRNNLGTNFALPNEVSGVTPGSVTSQDYDAWRARFGRTSGAGAGAFVANAVPEPSAVALLLFVSLFPLVSRSRQAQLVW
jgi:hypothetical protein